jgi:hypothetical protein
LEGQEKDFPSKAPLDTFIGALTKKIEAKGLYHRGSLIKDGHPNLFVSVPKIYKFICDTVMARHPKSLAVCMLTDVEEKAQLFSYTMLEQFQLAFLCS